MIKWKDVAHLYLGCECQNPEGVMQMKAVYTDSNPVFYDSVDDFSYDEIKPILRPLSDMTEEEMKEWVAIGDGSPGISVNFPSGGYSHTHWLASEKFLYLLSRHFDLFGLIETNQAIKK